MLRSLPPSAWGQHRFNKLEAKPEREGDDGTRKAGMVSENDTFSFQLLGIMVFCVMGCMVPPEQSPYPISSSGHLYMLDALGIHIP